MKISIAAVLLGAIVLATCAHEEVVLGALGGYLALRQQRRSEAPA